MRPSRQDRLVSCHSIAGKQSLRSFLFLVGSDATATNLLPTASAILDGISGLQFNLSADVVSLGSGVHAARLLSLEIQLHLVIGGIELVGGEGPAARGLGCVVLRHFMERTNRRRKESNE